MAKHIGMASTNGLPLPNSEALAFFLMQAAKLYTDFRNRPPPIPPNVRTFAPCNVKVTDNGATGRIRFLRLDGTVLHEAQWPLK